MLCSLLMVTASAAEPAFKSTAAKVSGSDTFTVSFTQPEAKTVASISLTISFDNTAFEITEIANAPFANMQPDLAGCNKNSKISITYTDPNSEAETNVPAGTTLISATFKIKEGATSGAKVFSVTNYKLEGGTPSEYGEFEIISSPDSVIGSKTLNVEVVSAISGTQNITGVTAPAKGNTPVNTVTAPTGVLATIDWYKQGESTPHVGNFVANTVYQARITVKPDAGYQFADSITFTVDGDSANLTTEKQADGSYVLTKTFDMTADKDPLPTSTSVSITGTPQIDKPLTANVSGLPASPGALTYKWYRDGETTPISGANTDTYTPSVAADVGKQIKVEVSAANYSGSVTSAPTAAVEKKDYVGSAAVLPTGVTPTYNSVSFTGTAGQEYVCTLSSVATAPDTGWVSVNHFDGLTPDTQYKLWCRVAATATVKPSTARGDFMFTTFKAPATITIADPGTIVYDGSAVEVGSGKDLNYTYSGDAGTVIVKWYADNSGGKGSELTGGAPKNAGTYWIGVSAAEGATSAAVSEVTKRFTISPRNISEAMVEAIADQEYTGSPIKPTLTVTYNGAPLTFGTDYTVEYTSNPNVGTATATIKAKTGGNFIGEKAVTFKIKAKAITPVVTVTGSYEYTGAPITPTYKVEITSGGAVLPADQYDAVVSNNTNAGNGNIKITAKANGNYSFSEVNKTFAINAKNVSGLTATISDQTTIKGVGEFVDPVIKGVKDEVLTGTLTYAYGTETGKTHDDVVAMLKTKATNDVVTLNYTFTPTSTNYTGTKTGSFEVTVKDIEFLVGTAPASVANTLTVKSSPVYGDNWSDIVKKQTGVTITAKVGTATDTDQSHFTLRPTGKPSAGNGQTYELVYKGTINGTNYDNVVVVSGTVNVAPKTLTAADLTYSSPITKVYDGSDSAPTGLTVSVKPDSLVGTDTLTVTGTLKYNSANVNEADKITFTPTAITTGNYALAASEVLTITGAKITAKDVKLTGGINATDRSYVKDNKTVDLTKGTLTFDGLVSGETLDVNIPATGTISDAKVGAYNVTYSGVTLKDGTTGKASNYKLVGSLPTVTVNITKATARTLADIPVSQKYTVTTGEKAIGTVMPADAGTLTYTKGTESKTGSVTIDSWAVDTTGKVTYTLSGGVAGDTVTLPVIIGSDNYENSTVNVVITLTAKDNQAALTLTGGITVVYGQTLQLGTSGGSTNGAVTYTVAPVTGNATVDNATGKLTPTKAGDVTVTATMAGNAAYNDVTSVPVTITINKAMPTGTPNYTKITTSGKTLADANLTVGTITPAGTISWDAGNAQSVAANTAYNWTFNPTDTVNYNNLTGSITPYTVSHSGGGGGGSYTPSYSITVDKTENGTITVSPKSASKGDTVTITVKPDKGYELEMLKALDKDGDALKLTEKNGKYTFKMPSGKVTVKGSFAKEAPEQIFADVPVDAYYYEAVKWAAEKGITGGVGSNLFAPNQPCTRAQIVTFLWRAAGSPAAKSGTMPFTDVETGSWYYDAVLWAAESGIIKGTSATTFSPDMNCSRAQIVTLLYRAAGSPAVSDSAAFADVAADAYYADAVAWADEKGITTGIGGGLFGSDNDCTRAQIVTFLYRYMEK